MDQNYLNDQNRDHRMEGDRRKLFCRPHHILYHQVMMMAKAKLITAYFVFSKKPKANISISLRPKINFMNQTKVL